jgi:hypothetical protein
MGAKMNRNQRAVMLFGLLLISAMVLGCANNSRIDETVAYEDDLERARDRIVEAEQAGAAQFGGAQLALARDKVRAAERAVGEGESERARRLAVEAELDAELAVAINRNRETQALATEARSTLQTLEDELRRGQIRDSSER